MNFADLTSVLGNFSNLASVATLLAAVVLGLLNAKTRITIASLKESNAAYTELATAKDLQYRNSIVALSGKDKEIALWTQKCETLENLTTQAPSINELAVQLAKQHKEMMRAMSNMTIELGNVAKAVLKETNHADKRQ